MQSSPHALLNQWLKLDLQYLHSISINARQKNKKRLKVIDQSTCSTSVERKKYKNTTQELKKKAQKNRRKEKRMRREGEQELDLHYSIVLGLHVFWVTGAWLLWAYDFTLRGKSASLPGFCRIPNVTFNYIPLWDVILLIKDALTLS